MMPLSGNAFRAAVTLQPNLVEPVQPDLPGWTCPVGPTRSDLPGWTNTSEAGVSAECLDLVGALPGETGEAVVADRDLLRVAAEVAVRRGCPVHRV